jgi:molecular chaperone DnaK
MLVADARQAVKDEAPLERVQSLTSELQQALYGLQPAPAGGNGQQEPSGNGHGSRVGDDDVVDAEFDRG